MLRNLQRAMTSFSVLGINNHYCCSDQFSAFIVLRNSHLVHFAKKKKSSRSQECDYATFSAEITYRQVLEMCKLTVIN